jgi:eukaryotic-like serine/threonine-protein kinase
MERLAASLADRYRIERELGAGGMATVYLAEDLKHDRKVAIKVLKPELGAVLGAERFLSEIKVTANLQHPNLLPLFDSGEADGLLYYVMPYVEGETLRARLEREHQLPVDETLRLLTLMASALDYAHARGVVHRDLKPENILLQGGQPIIADFGIALAVAQAGGSRVTETGLSLGTPHYMSPEQATADRVIDARSDQYALGTLAYEMLTGEPPHTGASAQAIIARLLTETPRSVRATRPTLSPAVDHAVLRALAKSPADRFATCGEFARVAADTSGVVAVSAPGSLVRRRKWQVVGVAGLVLVAAVGYLVFGRGHSAAVSSGIKSIAVLPLDNYSADSTEDYFAEGMTDELTSDLATISQLRVTSRGSAMQFKGKNRPPTPEIGKALNVDAIVEGSVTRSGDKVRITAQLIDARADKHLWAQSFERKSSDVLALQAELASAIAAAINVQLTAGEQSRLATVQAVNPEAHDAYLKGRFFFNRPDDENLQKAIVQFNLAITLSPAFAPAYSGLSDVYAWAAFNEGFMSVAQAKPLARTAAERAVALDSMSAEAHTSLGVYRAWFDYDWKGSEQELRRALALNSNYAFAHDQLGLVLAIVGHFDEAIAEGQRAMALDPLSPSILIDATAPFMNTGRATELRELARRASDLDPTFYYPAQAEGMMALRAGNFPVAIAKLKESMNLKAPAFVTGEFAFAQAASGDRAGAMATIEELKKVSPGGVVAPFNMALLYFGLGDRPRALDYFEQAYAANSQQLVWLKVDPFFDPLRSEARFVALMKKLNFLK